MADEEKTANTQLRDAQIRNQIQLTRFSKKVTAEVHAILNESEKDLVDLIKRRLENSSGLDSPAEVKRLEVLLTMVQNLRDTTMDQVDAKWQEQLVALAKHEPVSLVTMLQTTAPVVLDLTTPATRQLKAIATSRPFEGRTLKEWASSLREDERRRMSVQIKNGMMAGEDSATIARRIVGSARLMGKEGVTEITRRNAEAITRTAVNAIANEARADTVALNKDIISEEMFLATLDSRTTPICRSLDGKIYPVGQGPRPPLHFSCRSLRVAVFNKTAIGQRPAKASTEQQLLREYNAANGTTASTRDDLPHGSKGKFDEFSRARVRELTGQVPASTTYQQWLDGQNAAFQDDVLGKTRGALFRDGGLTLDKFVNRNGDEITLAQLAKSQKQAFIDAGLDPNDWK